MPACGALLLLQCILGALGAGAALHAAYRVKKAADAIDSFPLRLLAAGLAVFAAALLLDAFSPLASPAHPSRAPWGGGRRPEQVTFIHVNHVSMLGQPLYMVAYTLYAAAVYGSHVEAGEEAPPERLERLAAGIPLVAMLYVDYNIAAVLLLAAAGYMVLTRGGARPRWLLFYTTLAVSHVAAAAAVYATSSTLLSLAVTARSLAPLLLYLPEPRQREPGGARGR